MPERETVALGLDRRFGKKHMIEEDVLIVRSNGPGIRRS